MEENRNIEQEQPQKQGGMLSALKQTKGSKQVDPKVKKQVDNYSTILMKIMHSKQTRGKVLDMLKATEPQQAIPATALIVNDLAEKETKVKDVNVILGASPYLVSDIIEIGNSAQIFNISPEQAVPIYQETLQKYIQKGLKDGSIDPVELQAEVEPLLNEQQKQMGMEAGQAGGAPPTATNQMAINTMTQKTGQAGMLQGGQRNG